jgi:membrane protein required for colicin V production
MGFTAIDILVLLAVGGGAIVGFTRGFVKEVLALAAWIVAIGAVKALHGTISALLKEPVGTDSGAAVLAFALIFGVVFLVIRTAGNALSKSARASMLGPFDRVLGVAFGALKGLIIATVVFLFFMLIFDTIYGGKSDRPNWITDSRTYPLLRASSEAMIDFIEKRRAE